MNGYFWDHTVDDPKPGSGHEQLLRSALDCVNCKIEESPLQTRLKSQLKELTDNHNGCTRTEGSHTSNDRKPIDFGIALGSGARRVISELRTAKLLNLQLDCASGSKGSQRPGDKIVMRTLILIVPALHAKSFDVKDKPYSDYALALSAVDRVIVLICGRDTSVPFSHGAMLGRDGVTPPADAKISVIDITEIIECPTDAVRGVLCSCEAMGLISRLAAGMSVEAALKTVRAKLISTD